jgi:hypothetical protein
VTADPTWPIKKRKNFMNHPIVNNKGRVVIAIAAWAMLLAAGRMVLASPQPINKVVVMVDTSGSYKGRQMEAIQKTSKLLEAISQSKVHRWEKGIDQIFIVSLDAIPEVIWKGNLREIKALDRNYWIGRFKARTDYAKCTDMGAAFNLADSLLEGDSRYVKKYLFAFTDLIDEPPLESICKCKPPQRPSLPPDNFPWHGLQDVSVAIFWVPPDQKLAWSRIAKEKGLTTFAIYTTSESAQVKIAPPPKARVTLTENEVQQEKAWYIHKAWTVVKWMVGLAIIMVLLPVLVMGRRQWRNRRSLGRPGSGGVPPLKRSLPGNRPGGTRPLQAPRRPPH